MTEAQLQKKIIDWLQAKGFWNFKTFTTNKKGVPDIIGCTPKGRFFAIEVKMGANTPSKIQEYQIRCINDNGGIAFAAWDLETVIAKLQSEA